MRSAMTTLRRNAIAILALVVAMAGTAYAGTQLPAGSVGTKQLKKSAVTTKKIADGAVTGSKLADGAVTGSKIDLGTLGKVPSAALADNALKLQGHPASDFSPAGALHGVTVVRTTLGTGPAYHSGFANCPAGQVATGGGAGIDGGGNQLFIYNSNPTNAAGSNIGTTTGSVPTRWWAEVYNSSNTLNAYVWVICAQK